MVRLGAGSVRLLLTGLVSGMVVSGCSPAPALREAAVGAARLALSAVPPDVQCLEVRASGRRTVIKQFSLVPGGPVTLEMTGLPLGEVHFRGSAFADTCSVSASPIPTWISDTASATVEAGAIAEVRLFMRRNGQASVDIDFEDDGGGHGGAGGTGSSCGIGNALDVWTVMDTGSEAISGVFALAPNDAWVTTQQHVYHWDGLSWTAVPFTLAPSEVIGPVWASGPRDVWVSAGARVMRWNGADWSDMAIPPNLTLGVTPNIVGNGADDVWVWVNRYAAHWDGHSWTERSPVHPSPDGWIQIEAFWPAAANDAWLAGLGRGGRLLAHWDGATWQLSVPPGKAPHSYTGMWGSSSRDIWLLGDRGMLHYDGDLWSVADSTLRGSDSVWGSVIWGSCASNVWASLAPVAWGYPGRVAHFDGTSWSTSNLVNASGGSVVATTGPDDVWIVSGGGTLFRRHPGAAGTFCGNGRLDIGEQCDPPDDRTCTFACQVTPGCGDRVVTAGEACDPPDGLTCDTTCQAPLDCGNGYRDPGEDCDPPGGQPGAPAPWCDNTCHIPRCGNGVIDAGESCDPPELGWVPPGYMTTFYCGPACVQVDACPQCRLDPASCHPTLQALCLPRTSTER